MHGTICKALLPLAAVLLAACPPRLDWHGDDDDDSVQPDDDDTTSGPDPCCEADGDSETWQSCFDNGSAECVCAQDPYCCEQAWDSTCRDLYVSPCGALTCAGGAR